MNPEVLHKREKEDLSLLAERLIAIEAKYRQLEESKPRRLTIPAIFGRASDENFLSDYLAYVLDPDRNGVGIEPLQELLSLAYDNIADIDPEQVAIEREYTFKDPGLGRIDLLIQLGEDGSGGVIGIENKIHSWESGNQTIAYAKGLQKDFKRADLHIYIYLTPNPDQPASKKFKRVSYADLAQALRQIRYPVLDDIHKSVIWEDFLAHLEDYIVMSTRKMELSGQTRLYLEHHHMLESLSQAYQQDAQMVYDYVTSSISRFFGDDWTFHFQGRYNFQEVDRKSWRFEKYRLFYQYFFGRSGLLIRDRFGFMLGVYPKNPESRRFLDWFQASRPQIRELCDSRGMNAYPGKVKGTGSHVIAYKEYPLVMEDLASFDRPFVEAAEEFSPFTPIVDDAIQEYKRIISAGKQAS